MNALFHRTRAGYAATAVPLRTAVDQFLPKMRDVAQKIEAEFVNANAASA